MVLASCSSSKPSDESAGDTSAVTSEQSVESSSSTSSEEGSSGSSSGAESSSSAAPAGKASKDYKLAFIEGVQGDNFYITMQCGIEAAAKDMGVSVTTQGPQKFDPTLQKPILDSVVASKPDAILIAPTNGEAMQAPLQQAASQGIKIVLVDTTTVDPSYAVSQISSDNEGGGAAAFEAIKTAHPDGGKVLMVSVDPGITTTDARAKGFYDAAGKDSKFTTIPVEYSHNDPSTAAQIVTAALQKDPDIVGIFAGNLFAAQGAATGIQQAGAVGKVTVVGFDAGPDQIAALKAGTIQALVAQQPGTIGTDGVEQAINALDGHEVTPKIQTGFTIITKDNVDTTDAAYVASCS
jgi:ribose transport system substrate-binding protein